MNASFSRQRVMGAKQARKLFDSFLHGQVTGGVILLICAVVALLIANTPSLSHLSRIWDEVLSIKISDFSLEMPLLYWVNDGLMAIFFFVVGLEIKREILVGELCTVKQALLPVFAAVGGMVVPALIYSFFNAGTEGQNGWGIPMATDIAFAIGIISLLGNKVPLGLKVFLTALAIVDDLGAILVLAIFYPSHALHPDMLIYAAIVTAVLVVMGRYRVRSVILYVILGLLLWYFIYSSGVHATIAGVIMALTIPSKNSINEVRFYVRMKHLATKFKKAGNSEVEVLANKEQQHILHEIHETVELVNPMMHKFEHSLHPWVTFFIMPLFALANAGVVFDPETFTGEISSVVPGIFFGLLLGKPLGIFLMSLIVVKARIADLPAGTGWLQVLALGVIAGIGFTMSIFINGLAFDTQVLVDTGKASILLTSLFAALLGLLLLYLTTRCRKTE